MDKNYYAQLFLKKWKYLPKESKMTKFINNELKTYFDESDEEISDEE